MLLADVTERTSRPHLGSDAPLEEDELAESFAATYIAEAIAILRAVDTEAVERVAARLARVRERGGRLFILGVGGSAGNAGHAVNDFRKICGIEAYAPTDNVSELTARVNDEGWEGTFTMWLKGSRLRRADAILVLSVGGGDAVRGVSLNIVRAIELAKEREADVLAIVGRDGGAAGRYADAAIVIPPLFPDAVTPHTEGLCAVMWHLLVAHPRLQLTTTRWESLSR